MAVTLVDELIRAGVREAVLCPGSRSAPLAYALQAADRKGRLRLHVRVDERSAGFLAVGLAKLTRVPAVIVTTSGTAVANLHPAVLEAHHAHVPLIVLTADRPPELRGTGANQTTVQLGMFGPALRWSHELGAPEARRGQHASWRSTVCRAVAAATGAPEGVPGPVHVNVPLREPLAPTSEDPPWPEPLEGRADGAPWVLTHSHREPEHRQKDTAPAGSAATVTGPAASDSFMVSPVIDALSGDVADVPRTVVVMGELPAPQYFSPALAWARRHGWPVIAEPFGPHPRDGVLPHGPLLLTATQWLEAHQPDRVITVGRITLSRAVSALLRRPGIRVEAVPLTAQWTDPSHTVAAVHGADVLDSAPAAPPDVDWIQTWEEAGAAVAKAVAEAPAPWPSGLAVARTLLSEMPSGATLFLGSANVVRDVDLSPGPAAEATVVASRGLAGIDGCVSTAVGLALAGDQPAYALMGDLTLLHDANGLLIGPHEPHPDLTIVVVNDDGGGIFTLLEPGEPERAADFERVFGTPTGVDLAALCAAHGVVHEEALTAQELGAKVRQPPEGLRVVEVLVERAGHRAIHARLRDVAAAALPAT
jgi:2-succinyl-5-enolpyruvyl-6-hydroxy-3-cyclohexene-1-carboxylate synthase